MEKVRIITFDGELNYDSLESYEGFIRFDLPFIVANGIADIQWYENEVWTSLKKECEETGEPMDTVWQPSVESFIRSLVERAMKVLQRV